VHVWDTRSMKHVQAFASHRGSVTSLAIRQGTGQLFSASADKTLKVWSLDDMAYVDTLFGHQSDVVAVHSQRRERVVTVGRDRTCRFWKVAEDSQLIFRPSPGDGHLESCAFTSPDTWITGSDDGTVSLWSTTKKRAVMSWRGVHGFGGGVDGEGEHGVEGPKFFTEEETAAAAKARADAQSLCGVSSLTANAPSGVSNAGRWVNAVAVGKGTDVCASGAGDGAIRLWRVCDDPGRQLVPLWCLPARGFVNSLAIASSGSFVLAGMGQEPRGGRWARDAGAKNGLLLHRLKLED
jgi:ribosomal RNA-processing protein 9